MNLKVCEGCKNQILNVKVDRIDKKCKFKNNNFIYKNGSPIKCNKYNKNKEDLRRDPQRIMSG